MFRVHGARNRWEPCMLLIIFVSLSFNIQCFMMTGCPNPRTLAVRRQSPTRQPADESSIAEVAGHRQVSERQHNRSGECLKLTRGSSPHGALLKTRLWGKEVSLSRNRLSSPSLCFPNRNESILKVPKSWTVSLDEVEVDGKFMSFVIADLTVQWILQMLPSAGTVLADESDPVAASLLSQQLSRLGKKALFLTSSPEMSGRNWVYAHPQYQKSHHCPLTIRRYLIRRRLRSRASSQSLGSKMLPHCRRSVTRSICPA
jgi:hypothetical protein